MINKHLQQSFKTIRKEIGDPKKGLGHEIFHFVSSLTPIINVDLLIINKLNEKLLTWREDEFYGPGWHLPGGVVRFKEDPSSRILKVAASELGCIVHPDVAPITVRSQIAADRDIRGHFLSLLYSCSLKTEPLLSLKALTSKPVNGKWMWFKKAPPNLISVHESFRCYINGDKNETC